MQPDEDDERLTRACADAVQQAMSAAMPGSVVLKWVVAVEVLESEGERALFCAVQEDMRQWETLGILEFLRAREYVNLDADD